MKLVIAGLIALLAASGCGKNNESPESVVLEDQDSLFAWGTSAAPVLEAGPGAGEWNSEPPRADNVLLARSALTYLGTADARRRYGEEAAGTFKHYFENDGTPYVVSLPKMLADVPRVRALFDDLITALKGAAMTRAAGSHEFSMKEALGSSIKRDESENWYLAVDGFRYWISGQLLVSADGSTSGVVTLHLWDRYDWDPGVVIPIPTPFGPIDVDQDRVGEFHRQGLAKEFDTIGSAEIRF